MGPARFRTTCVEPNANGRVFGGQLLAQALLAAAQDVDAQRMPTAMQFMFLQGPDNRRAIDFDVTPLQDGKRFASRHVRGRQGERMVCDAHVSFAIPAQSPAHETPRAAVADPDASMRAADVPPAWSAAIAAAVGHELSARPALDFRLPDPPEGLVLALPEPRFRFWLRAATRLPDASRVHAAVLAYMSDHWFNYAAVGAHVRSLGPGEGLYMASLNHALWFHRVVRADEWLLFDVRSPAARSGRGLVMAQMHDASGKLVASATQECIMLPRDDGGTRAASERGVTPER